MHKKAKLLTLTNPGQEVDRRAQQYLEKHRTATYLEACQSVLKADRDLSKNYFDDEPRLRDLLLIADFLNTTKDKELREELVSDIRSFFAKTSSPSPATALSQKLNSMNFGVYFVPVLNRETMTVGHFSSRLIAVDPSERARMYAILASAIQRSDFHRLRQCPTCKDFIVALDHRVSYCDKPKCKKEARKEQAKLGMRKKRANEKQQAPKPTETPLARFLEFMRFQAKPNPTEAELQAMRPVWKSLGGVGEGRKLINAWERKRSVNSASGAWKIKTIWFRDLTDAQREIFSS